MLVKMIKSFLLVAIACVLCGCAYKVYADSQIEYRTVFFCERLRPRECFNTVLEHYYNAEIQGETWDEYQTRMKERNYFLFHAEDGTPRVPKTGDPVIIECRVRIKK